MTVTPQAARDTALQRVADNAHKEWMVTAHRAVLKRAVSGVPFTSEDAASDIPPWITTHEPRAMGAVIRKALRDGLIEQIGWSKAKKVQSHSGDRRLYVGAEWLHATQPKED